MKRVMKNVLIELFNYILRVYIILLGSLDVKPPVFKCTILTGLCIQYTFNKKY